MVSYELVPGPTDASSRGKTRLLLCNESSSSPPSICDPSSFLPRSTSPGLNQALTLSILYISSSFSPCLPAVLIPSRPSDPFSASIHDPPSIPIPVPPAALPSSKIPGLALRLGPNELCSLCPLSPALKLSQLLPSEASVARVLMGESMRSGFSESKKSSSRSIVAGWRWWFR